MSENAAKTIFKIVGVLHILYALLTIGLACVTTYAGIMMVYGESLMAQVGEKADLPPAFWVILIAGTIFSALIGIGYLFSAWGLLRMKRWEPVVLTIIIVLSIVDMIINAIQNGIQLMSLVSVVFFFIWVGVLVLAWKNKHLFNR